MCPAIWSIHRKTGDCWARPEANVKEGNVPNISLEQGYEAMLKFLEKYYELTGADDIGALLGSMSPLADGKPADSAMWAEWRTAVDIVVSNTHAA